MNPTNISHKPAYDGLAAWLRPTKASMIVGMIFAVGAPMAIGIVGFCLCQQSEVEYNCKTEMIARGEVKREMLRVLKITKGNGNWNVSLGKDGKALAWRSESNVDDLRVGGKTAAYKFDDAYLIPRFDRGNFGPKWYLLSFGLVFGFVGGGITLLRTLRWRSHYAPPSDRDSNSSTPATSSRLPKPFSGPMMSFDHDPSDTELTCVLQCSNGVAGIKVVETDGMVRIRPGLFPVTGIMLSMILGAVVFTGVLIVIYRTDPDFFGIVFWVMLGLYWFFLIPFWWIVLLVINRAIAANDDFIRVDMGRRTLELCEEGRTFRAAEILAFTEISRYYRSDAAFGWLRRLQTSVLVRAADSQIELHALVDGATRPPWADRLASIFAVPVRRIKLNKSESRALNDR